MAITSPESPKCVLPVAWYARRDSVNTRERLPCVPPGITATRLAGASRCVWSPSKRLAGETATVYGRMQNESRACRGVENR